MKFVIQRVTEASCTVDGNVTGAIQKGFLVLIGIADTDTTAIADKMIKKLLGLRIFEDADGKTNLSLADVVGSLLLISQFTLYADCRKGNRYSLNLCFANKYLYLYYSTPPPAFQGICAFFLHFAGVCLRRHKEAAP